MMYKQHTSFTRRDVTLRNQSNVNNNDIEQLHLNVLSNESVLRRLYSKNVRMHNEDILPAIVERNDIVKKVIESSLNLFTNVKQVGSFSKQTNIQTSNFDFDLLVICNTAVETVIQKSCASVELYNTQGHIESAAVWLDELQNAVERACTCGSVTRTRIAMKLCVNGANNTQFTLDLIPTILLDKHEYIPDYSHSATWKQNFSLEDANILNQRSQQYLDLKVIIQLLKYISRKYKWKNIPSYALECLVIYYSDSVTAREWNSLSLSFKLQKVLCYLLQFIEHKYMSHRFILTENLLEWLSDADVVKISSDINHMLEFKTREEAVNAVRTYKYQPCNRRSVFETTGVMFFSDIIETVQDALCTIKR
jgi:hypothetical protein